MEYGLIRPRAALQSLEPCCLVFVYAWKLDSKCFVLIYI